MPIIRRNTSAPVGAAGRAQGGGMRVPGSTLQRQQQDTAEDFKLAKSALNVGTAVVAGVNAGISGQTTKDIGALAAQGIETGNAEDAGGFDIAKFTDETVDTLGGIEGMLSGDISQQNIAGNIITNYQTGVSIGNAHAKQQGEALIATASGDADISFNGDMARGNYNGSADRAYQAQVNSLNQAMNDPNTTPAVKANIQSYLQNDLAKASFTQEYSVKQANAIAKRNADTAKTLISAASDTGDVALTQREIIKQRQIGALSMTPEEVDNTLHKTLINNINENLADRTKTPNELRDYAKDIQGREDLSSTEKEKLNREAESQMRINKTSHRAFLAQMSDDPQIEQLYADAIEEGFFDSKKEAKAFRKKHIDESAAVDPFLPRKMNGAWTALRSALSTGDTQRAREVLYQTERAIQSQGSKEQDSYLKDQMSGMTKLFSDYQNAPVKTATGNYKIDNDDLQKVLEDISVADDPDAWFFKGEDEARTKWRKDNAAAEMVQIQANFESLLKQGKPLEARETYEKQKNEWKDLYIKPMFTKDFDLITRDTVEERNIIFGSTEEAQTTIQSQLQRLRGKASDITQRAAEESIAKQKEEEAKQRKADITEAQIQRRPSGEVTGSTASFLRTPAGRRFNNQ